MNRIRVRASRLTAWRPVSAGRALAHSMPSVTDGVRPAPRWLVISTGVLGSAVLALFIVGVVVVL